MNRKRFIYDIHAPPITDYRGWEQSDIQNEILREKQLSEKWYK